MFQYFNNKGIFTAADKGIFTVVDSTFSGVPPDEGEICHRWTALYYSSLTQRGQRVGQWSVVWGCTDYLVASPGILCLCSTPQTHRLIQHK